MANRPGQGTSSSPNLGEDSCCTAVKDENASCQVFAKHCFSRGQKPFATLASPEKLNAVKNFRFGYRGREELGPRLLRDPGSNLRRRLASHELRYHVGIENYHSANGAVWRIGSRRGISSSTPPRGAKRSRMAFARFSLAGEV